MLRCMTVAVPTRFDDDELATLDRLVADGLGENRSAVIRRAVFELDERARRARIGREIAESYTARPQTADDDAWAMANAIALTEAEPW